MNQVTSMRQTMKLNCEEMAHKARAKGIATDLLNKDLADPEVIVQLIQALMEPNRSIVIKIALEYSEDQIAVLADSFRNFDSVRQID